MVEILTVGKLTYAIKNQLEARFSYIAVKGEVSNLRKQSSGHIYFTLKDDQAQISVALFRGVASTLSKIPKEGDEIILKGELSVYPPRGNYQIIGRSIEYAGVGDLLQKLHLLKVELEKKGYFATERKRPLPSFPQKIGVVTSPTGSVIQDIIHVLNRRFSGFQLLLFPAKVQGAGAAEEIAEGIEYFSKNKLVDVLIIGRGGGSLEDLWPFNEKIIADALYHCSIPVISAVGHETDFSISDFVADARAPTPSAAAELVSIEKEGELRHLSKLSERFAQAIRGHLRAHKAKISYFDRLPSPTLFLAPYEQKIDDMLQRQDREMEGRLFKQKMLLQALIKQKEALRPGSELPEMARSLQKWQKDLAGAMVLQVRQRKEKLKALTSHLYAIDPRHLLKKGYAIAFDEKGHSVILSEKEIAVGSKLQIQLADGKILAERLP